MLVHEGQSLENLVHHVANHVLWENLVSMVISLLHQLKSKVVVIAELFLAFRILTCRRKTFLFRSSKQLPLLYLGQSMAF